MRHARCTRQPRTSPTCCSSPATGWPSAGRTSARCHLTAQTPPSTGDAFDLLTTPRYPFLAPYSKSRERLRQCLRQLGVDPVELYRQFAAPVDPDVVAREQLGLSPADVAMVTTALADG